MATGRVGRRKGGEDLSTLRLLNFSTHPGDLRIFADNWEQARRFLEHWEFDGFELYPVGEYPWGKIPSGLVKSLHLRFFVILRQGWKGEAAELERVFGDTKTAAAFYGSHDTRRAISETYRQQLDLARKLGCETVVFHPAHCELEYVRNWNFPWHWRKTFDLCAEVLNEALSRSPWNGCLLLENLWWPGSFRLQEPAAEYDYLRSRIEHPDCGIVLDTGHLLNRDGGFDDEREAIAWLLGEVAGWPADLRQAIRALHLTCSLSGAYIRASRARPADPFPDESFGSRLSKARRHVSRIDRHNPFTDPDIGKLFRLLEPRQTVFEFSFADRPSWEKKIMAQKEALRTYLW